MSLPGMGEALVREKALAATVERHARKAQLARSRRVRLIVVSEDDPLDKAVEELEPLLGRRAGEGAVGVGSGHP